MTTYRLIDLSKVPVPDIIETPDFEEKYQALKTMLINLDPDYAQSLSLESDPAARLLQVFAYREMYLTARINDATRANILASATGRDLDALASRYNIERLTIQPANPDANPPEPAAMEDDEALRRRVQMAFDGLNTAGSIDGYIFHALGANGLVRDALATSPQPTEIELTILSNEGNGHSSAELIESVRAHFGISADGNQQLGTSKIRPQGDRVSVQSASIVSYQVEATIYLQQGPDASVIRQQAIAAAQKYADEQHRLGADITRSGLHRALHQPGVDNVELHQPDGNISVSPTQAAYCTSIDVNSEVSNG